MREESGVPLGGIGAGKIEFFPNGRFSNIATNNNWDTPIVDSIARSPTKPRILEGFDGSVGENTWRRKTMSFAEGVPGCWLALHTPEIGARVLKTDVRPALTGITSDQIDFDGKFPRAVVRYSGLGSIDLSLKAFSGLNLRPTDDRYRESSLPLALFAFRLANTGDAPLPVHLAFSWQDLSGQGGYPHFPINNILGETPSFDGAAGMPGLRFESTKHGPEPRFESTFALRALLPDGAKADFALGWDPRWKGDDIAGAFGDGNLPNASIGDGTAGVLGVRLTLAPHADDEVVFALAWNAPHLIPSVTDWLALDDPQSSPPAPEWVDSPQPADMGHAYSNWFTDPWKLAEHGLRNAASIEAGIDDWQRPLLESSLPERFATALCNDLFPMFTNTWYTHDYTFSVNEAPTDMHGCMGTIDQRSVANAAISQSFPLLDRSELDLFTRDQIRADDADPRRYGTHWNLRTGRFDMPIDRAGSILHDVGWDHLEGGRTGGEIWLTPHWPDLSSVYVLQAYQHGIWNGDVEWMRATYPAIKAALKFQSTLDQTGNGIADLWGPGSLTYDTSVFPYFGKAPFVATLYVAALRAARELATDYDDTDFQAWCENAIAKATSSLESDLWNAETGHYLMWRDDLAANSDGTSKAHATSNPACHVGQVAGEWWTGLLGLEGAVPSDRAQAALHQIYAKNVEPVRGCPANESHEGVISESWTPYVLAYYAALAIAAGRPDEGWEAVEKIYRVRYELDGSPWDAPLEWSGDHNESAQWGRFYMSNPASWYVLQAIGGFGVDRLHRRAWLKPSWPASWGDELRAVPFFLPGLRGTISAKRSPTSWAVDLFISHIDQAVSFDSLSVALPPEANERSVTAEWSAADLNAASSRAGTAVETGPVSFVKPGDGVSLKATW